MKAGDSGKSYAQLKLQTDFENKLCHKSQCYNFYSSLFPPMSE
jgi:hypothetical protein